MIIPGLKHRVVQGFRYDKRTPEKCWCEPYERENPCKHLIESERLELLMKKFHLDTMVLFEDVKSEDCEDNYLKDKYPYQIIKYSN